VSFPDSHWKKQHLQQNEIPTSECSKASFHLSEPGNLLGPCRVLSAHILSTSSRQLKAHCGFWESYITYLTNRKNRSFAHIKTTRDYTELLTTKWLATVKYSRALSVGVLPRQTRSTPPSTGSNISVSVVEVVGSVVIVAVVAAVVLAVVAGVVVTLAVELTVVSTIDFHLPLQDASQLDFDWSQ
jgi:hypothetical protein